MKKVFFTVSMAVAVFFTAAVGLCVKELTAPQAVAAFEDGMRIVLDAGHGGIDGGVVGRTTGIKESELNLSITYKLKAELEDMGFLVTLTRKTDAGYAKAEGAHRGGGPRAAHFRASKFLSFPKHPRRAGVLQQRKRSE